jgi:acetyl esterase/lipase
MTTGLWAAPMVLVFLPYSVGMASGAARDEMEVRVERDLVYGKAGEVDLRLNLALPSGKGPFPAVVCIHGGGWYQGQRQDMEFMTELLARRGYVAATVSYRLVPSARFPAPIEDCKAAVRWLRANAAKYNLNPDRIGAIGPSAGGHLACLLGVTDKEDSLEGNGGNPDHSSRVQAVVSFFGRTNFMERTWDKKLEDEIFVPLIGARFDEKPELYKRISPIAYVSNSSPPFLFVHGAEDKLVPPQDSTDMAEKLRDAGMSAMAVIVEGVGHGSADWGDKWAKHVEQAVDFFDKHLKQ